MLDRRGHGDPATRRRSRIWLPVIVLVFGVIIFAIFLAIDQFAHDQESRSISDLTSAPRIVVVADES